PGGPMTHFVNEPLLELRRDDTRAQLRDALTAIDARLPLSVVARIGEQDVHRATFTSVDPAVPERVVAVAHDSTADDAAAAVVAALHEAGVPRNALAFVPGGDEPGRALVADPRVHTIAFTGSCAVGLAILRQAAEVLDGQHHIKRVIAEMGGKNCIIVDADA